MAESTITFTARIKGGGLTFPRLEFTPREHGIEKVELESRDAGQIRGIVHVNLVGTAAEDMQVVAKVSRAILDRISFFYDVAFEDETINSAPPTYAITGFDAGLIRGANIATLKSQLETAVPPRRHQYYGLLRSARQSAGPVEEFLFLYHILLMILGDNQRTVDGFIRAQSSNVPQTTDPRNSAVMETVYTRLRNEFAHPERGRDLDAIKEEMVTSVCDLRKITKAAIVEHT